MSEWVKNDSKGDTPTVDWNKTAVGTEYVGTYVEKKTGLGPNQSTLYVIKEEDGGNLLGIWETSVLRTKFEGVEVGMEVKIVYEGKKKSKKGPGTYHDFTVYTKKVEEVEFPI